MKYSFINITAVASFLLAWPVAAQTSNANAKRGKELFVNDACYQCHGREGQGGAAGARIAPDPIALPALIAYVRHPSGEMPPVSAKVVSDADLADIYAFLKTIPKPKPVDEIPLLSQAGASYKASSGQPEALNQLPEGKVKHIVAEKCVSCHKLETVTVARHTRDEWQKIIADMQAKGATLTPAEIPDVVGYLAKYFATTGAQATGQDGEPPKSQK